MPVAVKTIRTKYRLSLKDAVILYNEIMKDK